MGGAPSFPQDKKVVVVGGGYGGMSMAVGLKRCKANYTLVDARDSFHHCVGGVRAVVEPGFAKKTFIRYDKAFGDNFVKARVVDIDPVAKRVSLATGQTLEYDTLVIAVGSSVAFPGKVGEVDGEQAIQQYENLIKKIENSQRIAVIGGGPVGVEIAAEIATDFPGKEVIIVHSRDKLLGPQLTKDFHKRLDEILDDLKVTRVLNEKVTNLSELRNCERDTVKTDKGRSIVADIVMKCIGLNINSKAYERNFSRVMEPNGQLKVDKYLRVEGQKEVFAIGDCNNVPEVKLAYLAREQANCTLENVRRTVMGQGQELQEYKVDNQPFSLLISLGRRAGLAQNKDGRMLSEWMVRKLKSETMFVPRYWHDMGQSVPK